MSWRQALRDCRAQIPKQRITVGFDGFVDTIAHPLQSQPDGTVVPFQTIGAFGEFLVSKAEKSCSIELRVEKRQMGGNLPFLSRAAGTLGLDVHCIGMLNDPLFNDMPCTCYPFAAPGGATCLEFQDGKVMLSADCPLPKDAWQLVQDATNGNAPTLFAQANLLALVNWSELSFADALWQKTLDAVSCHAADKKRFAFFDLCDVSRRTADALADVLHFIGAFSVYRTTILSLNENEALEIGVSILGGKTDLHQIAQLLHDDYRIDEVLIHTIRQSILLTARGVTQQATDFVAQPIISTGAGDHFNGASCFAAVMGFCDENRVAFANALAHYYVAHGNAPTPEQLLQ